MKGKLIRPAVVALVVVAVALAVGGIAYAAIPDSGGVIHGCYQKNQGSLRVIDPGQGQTCAGSESPLNWSQTGPQGQPGQEGAPGQQGPPGPTGSSVTNWVSVPVQTVITLASHDTISLRCFAAETGAEAFNWKLTALAVGTVHS